MPAIQRKEGQSPNRWRSISKHRVVSLFLFSSSSSSISPESEEERQAPLLTPGVLHKDAPLRRKVDTRAAKLERDDLATRARTLWKTTEPIDRSSALGIFGLRVDIESGTYVYSAGSDTRDLFLIQGVR